MIVAYLHHEAFYPGPFSWLARQVHYVHRTELEEADGTAAMKNLQDPVPRSGLAGGPPRKVISAPAYDITGQSSGRSSSSDLPTGRGLAPTDRFVPDGPIHTAKPVAPN